MITRTSLLTEPNLPNLQHSDKGYMGTPIACHPDMKTCFVNLEVQIDYSRVALPDSPIPSVYFLTQYYLVDRYV